MLMDLQSESGGAVSEEMLKESLASNMRWVREIDLGDMLQDGRLLFNKYYEAGL